MSKIKVVELWGGPGSGKSTTAAGLFARLKVEEPPAGGPKRSVELVTEHAKEITWWLAHLAEGRPSAVAVRRALSTRQAVLFGEQWTRLARLEGQVDVAISDSPLWLCTHYSDPDLYPREHWRAIIAAHYAHRLDVAHVWVRRVKSYETRGRNESEEQARAVDAALRPIWQEAPGLHLEVPGDASAPEAILRALGDWIDGATS